eukprot:TRINITY_DN22281_c0_g1_i2.p1 TRINITY_DN22281_c0_g1~~TRINITY_DN22281_c0_g1_i2.p1  ORF type:complete len:408 (-),score=77.23 TRINITY_DN22281_c0_g1_i2:993-2216(-)
MAMKRVLLPQLEPSSSRLRTNDTSSQSKLQVLVQSKESSQAHSFKVKHSKISASNELESITHMKSDLTLPQIQEFKTKKPPLELNLEVEEEDKNQEENPMLTRLKIKERREHLWSMETRLTNAVRQQINLTFKKIKDTSVWKKKHGLSLKTKVYIVMGGYKDLKKALDERGWIENPDQSSPCFDLKWTLLDSDIDYGNLQEGQIVNHFQKNTEITSKVGLCRNLPHVIWFNNVDINTFFPKCFDLNDDSSREEFIKEYKLNKAEAILKEFMLKSAKGQIAEERLLQVEISLEICKRFYQDLDELIDDNKKGSNEPIISDEEWNVLSFYEISEEELAKRKCEQWFKKLTSKFKKKRKKGRKKTLANTQQTSLINKEGLEESKTEFEVEEPNIQGKKNLVILALYHQKS